MAIEFHCPSCQSLIRTPDGSSGKQARCPKCSATVVIPAGASEPFSGQPLPSQQPPSGPLPSLAPLSPFAPAQSTPPKPQLGPANPFGEGPASPFAGGGPINPYASPNFSYAPGQQPLTPELARKKLLIPAIGMAASTVFCLGYALLTIVLLVVNPDQFMKDAPPVGQAAERAGFFFGMFAVIIVMLVVPLIVALGTFAMFRGSGRALALTGAIAAVLPCNPCCFIGFPFGIWALVVLNQADVKAAMR